MNESGHDTHLYDPDRHDNQIVAVYEDDAAASQARDALRSAGIPDNQIQLVSAPVAITPKEPDSAGDQILTAFMSLFTSAEDHPHYEQAIGRGHAMVIVTPTSDTDRRRLIETLENSHPIDFDAKLEEWRQAGYQKMAETTPGDRRVGRREPTETGARVRSYIADRPNTQTMGTGGDVTNATAGAQSSGTNAPR